MANLARQSAKWQPATPIYIICYFLQVNGWAVLFWGSGPGLGGGVINQCCGGGGRVYESIDGTPHI